MARTVTLPAASRVIPSGAIGAGGPSISRAGCEKTTAGTPQMHTTATQTRIRIALIGWYFATIPRGRQAPAGPHPGANISL